MKLFVAKIIAEEMMYLHGLYDWKFAFDTAKKRFGCCHFHSKTISLSADIVALNDEETVKKTILHEIAHALCGHKAGHGKIWKEKILSIGGEAKTCYSLSQVKVPLMKFSAQCTACNMVIQRKIKTRLQCRKCKQALQWKENK